MRRFMMLALVAAAFAVVTAAGTSSAQAQPEIGTVVPVPVDVGFCYEGLQKFDIDGNGYVGKSDVATWWNQLSTAQCPWDSQEQVPTRCAEYDLNGDGLINNGDVALFANHLNTCFSRTNVPIRPGQNDPRP